MHILAAAYMGVKPQEAPREDIAEASEFMPVSPVSRSEFDDLLKKHGLPIKE